MITPQEIILLNLIYCTKDNSSYEKKYYYKALDDIFRVAERNGLELGIKQKLKKKILNSEDIDEEIFNMLDEVTSYITMKDFVECLAIFPSFSLH